MSTRKKIDAAWLLVPLVIGVFLFSAITWLSTSDSYTDASGITHSITGWEVIRVSKPNFFTWVWIGLLGTVVFSSLAYFNESGAGKIGRSMRGYPGVTWIFAGLALLSLIVPWVPALSAKTEGGIFQQPKYQSSLYDIQSNRTLPDACMVCGFTHSTDDLLSQGRSLFESYSTRPSYQESMACSGRINSHMGWSNDVQIIWTGNWNTNFSSHLVLLRWGNKHLGTKPRVVLHRNYSSDRYCTDKSSKLDTYRSQNILSNSEVFVLTGSNYKSLHFVI
jgi:hypothetical protein